MRGVSTLFAYVLNVRTGDKKMDGLSLSTRSSYVSNATHERANCGKIACVFFREMAIARTAFLCAHAAEAGTANDLDLADVLKSK